MVYQTQQAVEAARSRDNELDLLQTQLSARDAQTWKAFEALGHHPGTKALEILLEQTNSTNLSSRGAAVRAIGTHSQGRTSSAVVLKLLQDRSPYVVREACNAAAQLRLTEAHSAIINLLNSHEIATRRAALEALRLLWQPADLERILDIFLNDKLDELRYEAGWTLRANVDDNNWQTIFNVLHADTLPRHRTWAAEIVGEFGRGHSAEELLKQLLEDKDGHVRKAAQRALAKVNNS